MNHIFLQKQILSCQIKIEIKFKNNYVRKIMKYDKNIHKSVIISDGIFQTNKNMFFTVNPKNAYRLEFADNLWIQFLYQLHSDVVFFAITTLHMYISLVKKWKILIGPNYIITFNENLENISTSIIELANINESSHEEAIVIFITKNT